MWCLCGRKRLGERVSHVVAPSNLRAGPRLLVSLNTGYRTISCKITLVIGLSTYMMFELAKPGFGRTNPIVAKALFLHCFRDVVWSPHEEQGMHDDGNHRIQREAGLIVPSTAPLPERQPPAAQLRPSLLLRIGPCDPLKGIENNAYMVGTLGWHSACNPLIRTRRDTSGLAVTTGYNSRTFRFRPGPPAAACRRCR